MVLLDWIVVAIYIGSVVGMSLWLSRRQSSEADYYLAGRKLGAWPLALSIVATQCSANSLIGAPAFIALKEGGGLAWLQYELAVPLAAIVTLLLVPVFFRRQITTIYETVEHHFGPAARTTLSGIFLFSRALGTGVTLYATAVVVAECLGCQQDLALLFVGAVSILYTTLGGIEADIYSDILQLGVLFTGTIVCIIVLLALLGGFPADLSSIDPARLQVIDFQGTGLGDGKKFAFWPMLIGGFFLYISYYGCDQSQAQRVLSARNPGEAQKALVLNGLLRFPLVCTYCLFGLLLAVWLTRDSQFAAAVMARDNPNSLVPMFILSYVPTGIRGLIVAGIIAAAMSSLDSAINSLSAATQRDFIDRFIPGGRRSSGGGVLQARVITVLWGVVCTALAYLFVLGTGRKETVLELVNIIGSAVYGPILAVFVMTLLPRRVSDGAVVVALLAGLGANLALWLGESYEIAWCQGVSWLWWNVIGCVVTLAIALLASRRGSVERIKLTVGTGRYALILVGAFVAILTILLIIDGLR